MKFPTAILTYIAINLLSQNRVVPSRLLQSVKRTARRVAFGALCLVIGVLSASLTFIFASIAFFLNFTEQSEYVVGAMWTAGTLGIITLILFFSGIRFISRT